jgi:biotin carboxyl carrier protein
VLDAMKMLISVTASGGGANAEVILREAEQVDNDDLLV